MMQIDYAKAVQLHIEKFGKEPVITGTNFFDSARTVELIMDAIDAGKPYEEPEVKDGVLI